MWLHMNIEMYGLLYLKLKWNTLLNLMRYIYLHNFKNNPTTKKKQYENLRLKEGNPSACPFEIVTFCFVFYYLHFEFHLSRINLSE